MLKVDLPCRLPIFIYIFSLVPCLLVSLWKTTSLRHPPIKFHAYFAILCGVIKRFLLEAILRASVESQVLVPCQNELRYCECCIQQPSANTAASQVPVQLSRSHLSVPTHTTCSTRLLDECIHQLKSNMIWQTFIWPGSETAKSRLMNVFIATTTSSPALLVNSLKTFNQKSERFMDLYK